MSEPPTVSKPLFMLDYDGTLAEIVDNPDEAFAHEDVPSLLQQGSTKPIPSTSSPDERRAISATS